MKLHAVRTNATQNDRDKTTTYTLEILTEEGQGSNKFLTMTVPTLQMTLTPLANIEIEM